MFSCIIDIENAGRRLDVFLRQTFTQVPLGNIHKWIRLGVVRVNDTKQKPFYRLQYQDTILVKTDIQITQAPPVPKRKPTRKVDLNVLFEDACMLIVAKPAGLVCHPGTKHKEDSLSQRIEYYCGSENALPGHRPGLVQRLDQFVSGVIPVGKNAQSLRVLHRMQEEQQLKKHYHAWVLGHVQNDTGTIRVPLRVDDQPMGDAPKTFPDFEHGKPSITHYQVLKRFKKATLLDVWLETGRTHQIRAHMKYIEHPILGDPRYGDSAFNQFLFETHGFQRIALHAFSLNMLHPFTHEALSVQADYPPELVRLSSIV